MQVYLFGCASGDFLMRVIVTPDERTVAQLAAQLVAWSLVPERDGAVRPGEEIDDVVIRIDDARDAALRIRTVRLLHRVLRDHQD